MKESPADVIFILKKYENNLTARRWLKDPEAIDTILDCHQTWNEDHEKIGEHESVLPLEVNIADYLNHPEKIDQYLINEKEPPK